MKKILFLFAFTFSWFFYANAQKEKLVNLFDKYQEAEGVTSIKIAKPMFSMLSKLEIDEAGMESITPVLDKIEGLRILVFEKPTKTEGKETEYASLLSSFNSLQSEIAGSVKNMNYEELITVKSKGNNVRFLSSNAVNGILDNLLLSINSNDSTVLMMLDGKLSMDDVNLLINESQNAPHSATESEISSTVRNVASFNAIEVSSGIKVTYSQDKNQKVTVNTDADLQKYIRTEVSGGVLKIFLHNPERRNLSFKKMHVSISAPALKKISATSGANFTTLNTLNVNSFEVESTSGATVVVDVKATENIKISSTSGANVKLDLSAKNVNVNATSGSDMTLTGKADETVFDLTSAATVNAQDLVTKNTSITATSASNLKVNVSGELKAHISSKASVRYRSNNSVDRNAVINSGGSLKPL